MYKVVIIGAGNIGAMFDSPENKEILTHAHGFSKSPYFQLKGFYDVEEKKAQEAAKRWNTESFSDLETALKETDVVCCCVPDEFHYGMLKQIAEYPVKLVVTEKPLTKTLTEAEEIQKLYQDIPCIVNYSRRFLKEFGELKERIPGYGRFLKGNGYYGKGILHNGSHMIDLLEYLFDCIEGYENPEYGICDFYQDDKSCDVKLNIADGTFRMNGIDCSAATIFELDLFFEKARIRILDGGVRIETYMVKESPTYAGYYNYILDEVKEVDYSNAILGLVENAGNFLEGKEAMKSSVESGRRVLELCLNIQGDLQ